MPRTEITPKQNEEVLRFIYRQGSIDLDLARKGGDLVQVYYVDNEPLVILHETIKDGSADLDKRTLLCSEGTARTLREKGIIVEFDKPKKKK